MTALRDHLSRLRAEYRSAGYPRDLSADVLRRTTPPQRAWPCRAASMAALAVAAAVTVVAIRHPAPSVSERSVLPPRRGPLALVRPVPLDRAGVAGGMR